MGPSLRVRIEAKPLECQWFLLASEMARCKNAGGGPGDEDPWPLPRLTAQQKGKAKKTTKKKRKFDDVEAERAAIVAAAVERAERGGARSGVHIADQLSLAQRATVERVESLHGSPARTVMLGGQCVGIEESQPQGKTIEQQTQPAEQSEDTQ